MEVARPGVTTQGIGREAKETLKEFYEMLRTNEYELFRRCKMFYVFYLELGASMIGYSGNSSAIVGRAPTTGCTAATQLL